ncbi:MAG: extracellular solute-binding protein [Oscillospiraceae bacterium]|nr:extracellular solute-binding protein [Oscillospiraceae bacterium]
MKEYICALLSLALFSLAACNRSIEGDRGNGTQNADGEKYYISETTAQGIMLDNIWSFTQSNDELVLVGSSTVSSSDTNEQGETYDTYKQSVKAAYFDLEGNLKDETVIIEDVYANSEEATQSNEYTYPNAAAVSSDGNIWFLNVKTQFNAATYAITNTSFALDSYDREGTFTKSIPLNGFDNNSQMGGNVCFVIDDEGHFYISFEAYQAGGVSNSALVFDSNGDLILDISEADEFTTKALVKLPRGQVAAFQTDANNSGGGFDINADVNAAFRIIELSQKGFGGKTDVEDYEIRNQWDTYFTNGSGGYDVLRCDKDTVTGISLESGASEIVAKPDGRFESSEIVKHTVISGENVFTLEFEQGARHSNGSLNLIKTYATDTLPDTGKIVLTMGTLHLPDEVKKSVYDFNKLNPDYQIETKEYLLGDDPGGVDNAIAAFNLDLTSGNAPDIIMVYPSFMPEDSLTEKGVFADIYPFIESEPDLNREDYLPNVFKALETDGKLYTVAPSFSVNTLIGKTSEVGSDMGWTWEEFDEYVNSNPDAIAISTAHMDLSKEDYLKIMLRCSFDEFVNVQTATCNFETPLFLNMLKSAEKYAGDAERNFLSPSDFASGERLMIGNQIYVIDSFITQYESIYFGEEITYKGFPSNDGKSGSLFEFQYKFGISDRSENKDGAFQFIKFLLTDFQYSAISDEMGQSNPGSLAGIPIKKDAIEQTFEAVMDSFGNHSISFDGIETFTLKKPTEADMDKLMSLIHSVEKETSFKYEGVFEIVREEADYYFNGEKTAEEVARIIQSRCGIYLSEMS